jgi:hypothetical protein
MRCLSAPFSVMTRYGITGKFTFDVAELPIRLRWAPISAWGGLERLPEHDETYIYRPMIHVMAAGSPAASPGRNRPPLTSPATSRMRFLNRL